MSDEKQLTVAELLARNRRSDADANEDYPRRRRHRSLEEGGGISVAELTGSVPRVKEKPAESRHSSVPIDALRRDTATPRREASPRAPEARRGEGRDTSRTAARPPRSASSAAPRPAAKSPEYREPSASERRPSEDETAVIQRIREDERRESGSTATERAAREAEPRENRPRENRPREAAARRERPAQAGYAQAPRPHSTPSGTRAAAARAAYPEQKGIPGAQPARGVRSENAAAKKERDFFADEPEERRDEGAEESGGGIGPVLLFAVMGVVLGAVLFVVFSFLWGSQIPGGIVALFALVVTGALVGVVHMLRTANDKMSMILSGIVGVLMTFGPAIPGILT